MGQPGSRHMAGGLEGSNSIKFYARDDIKVIKNEFKLSPQRSYKYDTDNNIDFNASHFPGTLLSSSSYSSNSIDDWLDNYNKSKKSKDILAKLNNLKSITVTCFHVSCSSCAFLSNVDGVGMVVYQYNKESKWELNNKRCRSGYIVYVHSNKLEKITRGSTYHEKVWIHAFGNADYSKATGGGFAYKNGKLLPRSGTFNCNNDGYHVTNKNFNRELHYLEFKWIKKAMNNWKNYQQNTQVHSSEQKLYIHHQI